MTFPLSVMALCLAGYALTFHPKFQPSSQYYANPSKRWIKRLNREEINQVFSNEDLLYRLSNDQMAALGDRLLELDK